MEPRNAAISTDSRVEAEGRIAEREGRIAAEARAGSEREARIRAEARVREIEEELRRLQQS